MGRLAVGWSGQNLKNQELSVSYGLPTSLYTDRFAQSAALLRKSA